MSYIVYMCTHNFSTLGQFLIFLISFLKFKEFYILCSDYEKIPHGYHPMEGSENITAIIGEHSTHGAVKTLWVDIY